MSEAREETLTDLSGIRSQVTDNISKHNRRKSKRVTFSTEVRYVYLCVCVCVCVCAPV